MQDAYSKGAGMNNVVKLKKDAESLLGITHESAKKGEIVHVLIVTIGTDDIIRSRWSDNINGLVALGLCDMLHNSIMKELS